MKHIVQNMCVSYDIADAFVWWKYKQIPSIILATQLEEPIRIDTLEGTMIGNVGDWLLRDKNGKLRLCKDEVFSQTYMSG